MEINEFKLERYFSRYEFNTEYLLSSSDCESLQMKKLLAMVDQDSRKLWQELKLGYTESRGHPLLREEIATLYDGISPEEVQVVAPAEGIFIALNSILEPDDHVISIFPSYQSLQEIPSYIGCRVTRWPLRVVDNRWRLDLTELKELIEDKTRLLIINFPHNPTGFLPGKDEYQQLLQIAAENDIYLFSDEIYKFSEFTENRRLRTAAAVYRQAVSLGGLSKSFGLPGLRIGWLITKNEKLYSRFTRWRDYTTICSGAPAEILAILALRVKEKIISRNLKIIGNNLTTASEFFAEYSHLFDWLPPEAGPIAFPRLQHEMKVADFCRRLVEEQDVMLLPGAVFQTAGNHFRLGMGRKNFIEGLERMESFARKI